MAKQWDNFKDIIVHLYKDENHTLDEVRSIMKNKYGFTAATRTYRQHFGHWKVYKYKPRQSRVNARKLARKLTRQLSVRSDESTISPSGISATVGPWPIEPDEEWAVESGKVHRSYDLGSHQEAAMVPLPFIKQSPVEPRLATVTNTYFNPQVYELPRTPSFDRTSLGSPVQNMTFPPPQSDYNLDPRLVTYEYPLHQAIQLGDPLENIQSLIASNPAYMHTISNHDGLAPLHLASRLGLRQVVVCLLQHGADPNVRGAGGTSPLHEAASVDVARELITHGADINVRDDNGNIPLYAFVGTDWTPGLLCDESDRDGPG